MSYHWIWLCLAVDPLMLAQCNSVCSFLLWSLVPLCSWTSNKLCGLMGSGVCWEHGAGWGAQYSANHRTRRSIVKPPGNHIFKIYMRRGLSWKPEFRWRKLELGALGSSEISRFCELSTVLECRAWHFKYNEGVNSIQLSARDTVLLFCAQLLVQLALNENV